MKKYILLMLCILVIFALGCSEQQKNQAKLMPEMTQATTPTITQTKLPEVTQAVAPTITPTKLPEVTQAVAPTITPTKLPEVTQTTTLTITPTKLPEVTQTTTLTITPTKAPEAVQEVTPTVTPDLQEKEQSAYLIAIDAGHQEKGNKDMEPDGPGSKTLKAKVSSGTSGVATGLSEYELNLRVSLKLKEKLEAAGYRVLMIRETNQVNISNAERAMIANEAKADALIRIHANSSDNSKAQGILTICQTEKNPYNGELHPTSKRLSELILNHVVQKTGAKKRDVWETDTMTGINWATVPASILEMGFMSNPDEDRQMATDDYQEKIVDGIVEALNFFFDIIQ